MGQVVMPMSVSLDGFFEGPNQEIDWHVIDDEIHQFFNDWLGLSGAFVGGRKTYELMEAFWPTADEDPDAPPPIREFAGIWRNMPKVVYSRTLDRVGTNATLEREVTREGVQALQAKYQGDLVIGGAEVGAEFRRLDLIDEYRIYVHPILIGRGHRLFTDTDDQVTLNLIETRTFSNGVVMLRYGPSRGDS